MRLHKGDGVRGSAAKALGARCILAWDPGQYLKFAGERLRPGFDLLARIGDLPPGPIYELGCGTGVHARAIAARWPDHPVTALDRSSDMLAEAKAAGPSAIHWVEADIAAWSAPAPAALIFSNATLQWLVGHEALFPHLLAQLAPGGVLAVQMPRNFDSPSHTLMRETAADGPWAPRLTIADDDDRMLLRREPVASPAGYYDMLAGRAPGGIDLWETEYLHSLQGDDPVLEWVRGTALRPVLDALPPAERASFTQAYAARLRAAYPSRRDGRTLYPFRRLFLIAKA
jgi:trans-aconitate 2-methyltransferase